MINKKTTSNSGKRKQKNSSAPSGDSQPAAGGELHQIAGGEHPALTTNQGVPLSDNQNSLRANTGVVHTNDKDAFIAAAKTRQWAREKSVRTLA